MGSPTIYICPHAFLVSILTYKPYHVPLRYMFPNEKIIHKISQTLSLKALKIWEAPFASQCHVEEFKIIFSLKHTKENLYEINPSIMYNILIGGFNSL